MNFLPFLALQGEKKKLMTARVSMLLKSRASLTCFRANFLPGRAKDLSAPYTSEFGFVVYVGSYSNCSTQRESAVLQWVDVRVIEDVLLNRTCSLLCRGADKSLARPGRKQARKHVMDTRDFNNIETRAVIRQGAEGNSRHSDRNISLFPSWSG